MPIPTAYRPLRRAFLLVLLPCLAAPLLRAQWDARTWARVDALFDHMTRADSTLSGPEALGRPGCALAIVSEGEIVHRAGYGMADLEQGTPIAPGSVFYAGSVSKQFVATCVLLLQEEGKLRLDDDVRSYVPELPDYGPTITLRHLVHHTSGLRDYLDLWSLSGRDYLNHMPDTAVLDMIFRQRALNFPPGSRYAYSNSGYFLLKEVVERVSGRSLGDYAREHIFAPLGMRRTHFHDDVHHIIPGRAEGYRLDAAGNPESLSMRFDLVGSGGLYTTVEDLFLWDSNFYHNRLGGGGRALIDTLQRPGRLNDGSSTGYAFAMRTGAYRGLPTISHTGSMGGYRAYYLRLPEQRFSVILLGNFAQFRPVEYAERIVDLLLAPEPAPAPAPAGGGSGEARPLGAGLLGRAPGGYYSPELDARARVTRHGDDLWLQVGYGEPLHLREWLAASPSHQFDFEEGAPAAFRLGRGGIRDILFTRTDDQ